MNAPNVYRLDAIDEVPPTDRQAFDYADAFEIARSPQDLRSAERWARDGFGRLPITSRQAGLLAHRYLLGFRLGPWTSADHIFGWRVVESYPERLHLEARGRVMTGHMVWRRQPDRLVMTTFVVYHRPQMAARIWALAGRIHRHSVPGLLRLAASAAPRSDDVCRPAGSA